MVQCQWWSFDVFYKASGTGGMHGFDREADKIAGRESIATGYDFGSQERDIEYSFPTYQEARVAHKKFLDHPLFEVSAIRKDPDEGN